MIEDVGHGLVPFPSYRECKVTHSGESHLTPKGYQRTWLSHSIVVLGPPGPDDPKVLPSHLLIHSTKHAISSKKGKVPFNGSMKNITCDDEDGVDDNDDEDFISPPSKKNRVECTARPYILLKRGDVVPIGAVLYFKQFPFIQLQPFTTTGGNIMKHKKYQLPKDVDTETDDPHFKVAFEVHSSLFVEFTYSARGWGLYTNEDITKGTCLLGEYVGEILSKNQSAMSRYRVKLENGYYIDARRYGNSLRFINSSCHPNAEYSQLSIDRALHIFVVTTRDIHAGEEIFCSYYDSADNLICDCLSPCNNPSVSERISSRCKYVRKTALPSNSFFVPNYYFRLPPVKEAKEKKI
jgi:SET domain